MQLRMDSVACELIENKIAMSKKDFFIDQLLAAVAAIR